MRPLAFDPQALRKHLRRHKIATLPELKSALGTATDLTVFRKLKLLDYLSSYTSRPSSINPRVAASPTNWPTPSMPRSKIPYTIWCARDVCVALR